MRLRRLICGDIQFQFKYGFYLVYTIFTLFYLCLLYAFPTEIRSKAAILLIYSDPAAMGLFFMGAIVLFEKSQRVINSIAVSPVRVREYIISKVVSLGIIGTLVGVVLAVVAGIENVLTVLIGTFLGSIIFSLIGLLAASVSKSLNHFMVVTMPFELLCILPPIIYLFGYRNSFMLLHPGCIVIRLMEGEVGNLGFLLLYLLCWIILMYFLTELLVKKMFQSVGGMKL